MYFKSINEANTFETINKRNSRKTNLKTAKSYKNKRRTEVGEVKWMIKGQNGEMKSMMVGEIRSSA